MQPRQRQETRPRRQQIPSAPPTSQPRHSNPNSNPSLEFLSSLELIDPILFPDDTMEDQQQQIPTDWGETSLENIDLLSPTFSPNFSSAFSNNCFPSPSQKPHSDQTLDTRNASCPTYPMTKTSSQTSSYFIVPTPSGLTGTSSFEQLHIRSYSDNSQRTGISGSESNGGAGYMSPPEDSCAIDTEMIDGTGETSFMPHDREQVLLSMSTAGPQPVLNPYAMVPRSQIEDVTYQDVPNFTYANSSMTQPYEMSPQPEKLQSSGPWTPIHPQVPRYDLGYSLFLPSPGPAVLIEDMDISTSVATPQSMYATKSRTSDRKSNTRTKSTITKGKEKAKNRTLGWENIVLTKDGQLVCADTKEVSNKRSGVRSGKLDPEAAAKALEIRRIGACWPCWAQKVTCSKGEVCERCEKHFSPLERNICSRANFKEFAPTFFPDYLHEHLGRRQTEALFSEHASHWTNLSMEVEISAGKVFKPMRLEVVMFDPKTNDSELINQTRLTTASEGQNSQIVMQYSAPLGLRGCFSPELKSKCNKHIEKMVETREYSSQCTAGNKTQLPREILDIVQKYCEEIEGNRLALLRNVMKLHAIQYFMSVLPTFTDECAPEICQRTQATGAPARYFQSRLLNRQIKFAMHRLNKEIMDEALEGLEKMIRLRSSDSWGPSFCAILVITLCIENMQIAADTFVLGDTLKEGYNSGYNRNQSMKACHELEDYPFDRFKRLFHDAYKTHKASSNGKDLSRNPLWLIEMGSETGLDSSADIMARSMYKLIRENEGEINTLARDLKATNLGATVEPDKIKDDNTGRLAAIFLKSFFPDR